MIQNKSSLKLSEIEKESLMYELKQLLDINRYSLSDYFTFREALTVAAYLVKDRPATIGSGLGGS